MSWVFNNRGKVLVVDLPAGVDYEPATLTLTDTDDDSVFSSSLSVLLFGFKRQLQVNFSLQTTIGGDIYYSEFGEAAESRLLSLSGIAFNPTNETDTSTYSAWTSFFKNYKGTRDAGSGAFPRLRVTVDGKTHPVYLVGAPIRFPAQQGSVVSPIFGFQMQCVVIS